jgi:RNA polymerase sigma-70 factor, ECF subfamily
MGAMHNHNDFHLMLVKALPRLRAQAMALTRNHAAAEDLLHDAVANALAARGSFVPGTKFDAWIHRILYNRFISIVRRRHEVGCVDDLPGSALAVRAPQEDRAMLRELRVAVSRLPAEQRATLLMVVLQGMSYEETAEATGCAVGTAKRRVSRARRQLQAWFADETSIPGNARSAARASSGGLAGKSDSHTRPRTIPMDSP